MRSYAVPRQEVSEPDLCTAATCGPGPASLNVTCVQVAGGPGSPATPGPCTTHEMPSTSETCVGTTCPLAWAQVSGLGREWPGLLLCWEDPATTVL